MVSLVPSICTIAKNKSVSQIYCLHDNLRPFAYFLVEKRELRAIVNGCLKKQCHDLFSYPLCSMAPSCDFALCYIEQCHYKFAYNSSKSKPNTKIF
jgi:hypothetical protein